MMIKLLIASEDTDYAEHLSKVLSESYTETFEVSVCSAAERLRETLAARRFDVILFDTALAGAARPDSAGLPMLLWDETASAVPDGLRRVRKYQRISSIAGNILECYAEISPEIDGLDDQTAAITAVWSPAGGVGTTSVALAYATRVAFGGKQVMYLDLNPFSNAPAYFSETGKSISAVFKKLESADGNLALFIRGISQRDSGTGITYFARPENYDDMNILSIEDIERLVMACAKTADELVIDMPCVCDARVRRIFEYAQRVLLVVDASKTAKVKLEQFMTQHNTYDRIRQKTRLVANKGASAAGASVTLPLVRATDETIVFKTLSGNGFEM